MRSRGELAQRRRWKGEEKVAVAREVAASDAGREEAEGSGLQLLAPMGADDDGCGRPGASRSKGGGGTRLRWDLTRLEKELQLRRASRATGAGNRGAMGIGHKRSSPVRSGGRRMEGIEGSWGSGAGCGEG